MNCVGDGQKSVRHQTLSFISLLGVLDGQTDALEKLRGQSIHDTGTGSGKISVEGVQRVPDFPFSQCRLKASGNPASEMQTGLQTNQHNRARFVEALCRRMGAPGC